MSPTPVTAQTGSDVLTRTLRINEIFLSLQGETVKTGLPTAFIRLTGCPLRCSYCDTEYAFHSGERMSIGQIMQAISGWRTRHVTVTGGEPLAQKACLDLLTHLCNESYEVSLETGGAMDISTVDPRVMKIVDLKTPASGESAKNRYENLAWLHHPDQIKLVICNRDDYEWARALLQDRHLQDVCEVLFSPSHGEMDASLLAGWILEDRLPVRFQIQLHKYLWGNVAGK
jgi:7-carboxy-7-deazaguanine synthase